MKRLLKKAEKVNVSTDQMKWILDFNEYQMKVIKEGLEKGLDVAQFADPDFNPNQMNELKDGLKKGIDISLVADPQFDYLSMRYLINCIEEGWDISWFANHNFDSEQIKGIYYCAYEYEYGANIVKELSNYITPQFDGQQIFIIGRQLGNGEDVSEILDPSMSAKEMYEIIKKN